MRAECRGSWVCGAFEASPCARRPLADGNPGDQGMTEEAGAQRSPGHEHVCCAPSRRLPPLPGRSRVSNTGRLGPLTLPRGRAAAPSPAARRLSCPHALSVGLWDAVRHAKTRGSRRPPQTEPRGPLRVLPWAPRIRLPVPEHFLFRTSLF